MKYARRIRNPRRVNTTNGSKRSFYATSLKSIKKHPISFGAITLGLGLLSSVYVLMKSRARRYF
ncbi:MAG: hypothetical protein SFW66_06955 [Gammaproteobacteria bacterium]|nr:hypothetical protein [Gammaproteobacteria bacterium]